MKGTWDLINAMKKLYYNFLSKSVLFMYFRIKNYQGSKWGSKVFDLVSRDFRNKLHFQRKNKFFLNFIMHAKKLEFS